MTNYVPTFELLFTRCKQKRENKILNQPQFKEEKKLKTQYRHTLEEIAGS